MNERLKTHSKTQKKSADLVSNKLRIGVFQRYQMKCKSVSKKSPRYTLAGEFPVSSAVVLCFRTQIFVTRSDVVLVSGIHRGEPKIVGRYDSLGNSLGA